MVLDETKNVCIYITFVSYLFYFYQHICTLAIWLCLELTYTHMCYRSNDFIYSLKSKPENCFFKRCIHIQTWVAKQMHSASDTEGAVDERTGQSHFSIQVNVHDNQTKFCMQKSLMSARKDFEWQTFNTFTVNKDSNSISPNCCFFHHFKEIKKNYSRL